MEDEEKKDEEKVENEKEEDGKEKKDEEEKKEDKKDEGMKLTSDIFLPTGWVGGREKIICCRHRAGPHTDAVSLGEFFRPGFPDFEF